MKKTVSTKMTVLLMAVVLLIGAAAGGTLAWLADKTDPVENTFTAGNIDITLTETWNTNNDTDAENDIWVGKMVPGTSLDKNPEVTVAGNSEACWLFVKVTEGGNADSVNVTASKTADTYITYDLAAGWTAVPGETGVYYREVSASAADQAFGVLLNDKVYVPNTVTKTMLDAVDNGTVTPKLTFTAYAVQKEGFATAALAWAEAEKLG